MEGPWKAQLNLMIQMANESRRETFMSGQRHEQQLIICYSPKLVSTRGVWQNDNILQYTVPVFLTQCFIVTVTSMALQVFTRRLHQPNFLADVFCGILLGPSVFGHLFPKLSQAVFPARSISPLESFAGIGLLYFVFVVGLQLDLSSVINAGRRAWSIAIAGSTLSLALLAPAVVFLRPDGNPEKTNLPVLGVSITITAYPVLVRILARKKLLRAPVGRLAMSAALVNGGLSWVLFAVATGSTSRTDVSSSASAVMGTLASSAAAAALVYGVVKPAARWTEEKLSESGEGIREVQVMAVLIAVMASGIVGDITGVHAVLGAFAMGVAMPSGQLAASMMERLEDFVIGFVMPIYFATVGMKVEVQTLRHPGTYIGLAVLVLLSAAARAGVTYVVCSLFSMSPREGLTMGVLMNTKGIMEVIFLQVALDKGLVGRETYTAMTLLSLLLTFLVSPLVSRVYRPPKDYFAAYKRRVVQGSRPDLDLRLVACVHTLHNVPAVVGLLEVAHPTRRSPVLLYALQLVELTGRESAMLVVHDTHNLSFGGASSAAASSGLGGKIQQQLDLIARGFHDYEQRAVAGGISIQHVTITSPYSSMHDDVCHVADDKHAAIVILPYHKQHAVDGGMEEIHPGILTFNRNVLDSAPCSVGILIDRGIGRTRAAAPGMVSRYVMVLFIGGPDDREALSLAARMAENPGVSLTVIRFMDANWRAGFAGGERELDDECVREFRMRTAGEEKVLYTEKIVANGMEMVSAIRTIDSIYDLYIVGRSEGVESPLTAGMTDFAESPELGAVGDLLCSSDFTATVSLLVVQQYRGGAEGAPGTPLAGGSEGYLSVGKRSSCRDKGVGWDP